MEKGLKKLIQENDIFYKNLDSEISGELFRSLIRPLAGNTYAKMINYHLNSDGTVGDLLFLSMSVNFLLNKDIKIKVIRPN
jgi:hypothetical protein